MTTTRDQAANGFRTHDAMTTQQTISRSPAPTTSFAVTLEITLRPCLASDLPALEWFGTFTHHRELIQKAFARQRAGEVLMLLAIAGDAPVGQVWIDLTRSRSPRAGWIWALRVFPWLCNHGIGSRLLDAAELTLARAGCTRAELSVERSNVAARRLYERRGYTRIRPLRGEHACTTPWGTFEHHYTEEWLMSKPLEPPAAWQDQRAPGAATSHNHTS